MRKKDKVSIKAIISNIVYLLEFTAREDPVTVIGYIAGICIMKVSVAVYETLIIREIINSLIDGAPLDRLLRFLLFATVVFCANEILEIFLTHFFEIRLIKTTGKIQRGFLRKSANMDLICYDKPEYFDDYVIAASQSEDMLRQAITCVSLILGDGLAIFSVAAIIMTINPFIAIFPIVGFVFNITTRFTIQKLEYQFDMEKRAIKRKSDYSKRVFYQYEYAKEIKLSDIEIPLKNQFNEAIGEEEKAARKYGVKIAWLSMVNWVFSFTILRFFCVPVYLGYLALVRMSITMGDVVAMRRATDIVQWRMDQVNYAFVDFQRIGLYASRFRRFIDYKEIIETSAGTIELPGEMSMLEIKNVSFSYSGDDSCVLKNINMTIKPGEKVAIVGENGAGKTTFVKLLMRLYDVSGGQILYGGKDIREFNTNGYRKIIGAVLQDYQLYAASLAENVKMDFSGVAEDTERLEKALELADFSGKYKKLSGGLQTELTREFSDSGTMLSGGESQKVAISRLFAKSEELPIAILDEPSSALDPIAEYNLNRAMAMRAEKSAIIFISHRLSTTRGADRIYMFENGEIAEQGSHDELMALQGKYAEMFEKQAHYYKLKV